MPTKTIKKWIFFAGSTHSISGSHIHVIYGPTTDFCLPKFSHKNNEALASFIYVFHFFSSHVESRPSVTDGTVNKYGQQQNTCMPYDSDPATNVSTRNSNGQLSPPLRAVSLFSPFSTAADKGSSRIETLTLFFISIVCKYMHFYFYFYFTHFPPKYFSPNPDRCWFLLQ